MPTPNEIRAVMARHLAENRGKTASYWSALISIEPQSVMADIHSNWRVVASGTKGDRAAINEVGEAMRVVVSHVGSGRPG